MTAAETRVLRAGLDRLEQLYEEAIAAFAPPNPEFERNRIIADVENRRELAYVLGFLSEGENETALLLALIRAMVGAQPDVEVAHVLDEAWYYLRTSIDSNWQLDRGAPSIRAALTYLATVIERRLTRVRSLPNVAPSASVNDGDERRLLDDLRASTTAAVPPFR